MKQLTVRNVPDEVARALRVRAASHGRSAESEHRLILAEVLGNGATDFWVRADALRARSLAQARLEAPDLLPVESANILGKKVRIGDLAQREATDRLDLLLRAPVVLVGSRKLLDSALRLSFDWGHPVYDCLYLALALQRRFPLVTADGRLAKAARKRRKFAAAVMLLADLRD